MSELQRKRERERECVCGKKKNEFNWIMVLFNQINYLYYCINIHNNIKKELIKIIVRLPSNEIDMQFEFVFLCVRCVCMYLESMTIKLCGPWLHHIIFDRGRKEKAALWAGTLPLTSPLDTTHKLMNLSKTHRKRNVRPTKNLINASYWFNYGIIHFEAIALHVL